MGTRITCDVSKHAHRYDIAVLDESMDITVYERCGVAYAHSSRLVEEDATMLRTLIARSERMGSTLVDLVKSDLERTAVPISRVCVLRHYAPEA